MDSPRREWRLAGIVFFVLIALAILWLTVMIVRPFLTAIMIGAILVTVTYGPYTRVRARLRGSDTWAAIVMLIGVTVVIIIPFAVIIVLLVQQANTLIRRMQSMETQQVLAKLDLADRLAFVQRWVPGFDPRTVSVQHLVMPVVQDLPRWVAVHGPALVGGVAGIVIGFLLVLLSAFFFYVEGEAILEELAILSPLPQRYDREFAGRFKDVIDATFRGHVLTALAQGVVTAIGLAIAGVSAPVFWGAVTAVLALLPMVGAAVVWIPAAIYLFVEASMGHGPYWAPIFLTIWGITSVSLVDNLVRSWTMKGKAQLPAIPLLFAVLGGMEAFGFVGLVIGPLVFSLLTSIIDIYKQSFRIRRSESEMA
jgi:predicted PurR-regulated permease PerM